MTDIRTKIKKIKFARLSTQEQIIYGMLEDAKLIYLDSTFFLVTVNNDVLVEFVGQVETKYISSLLRFNYDILWIPLLHNAEINYNDFLYPYLSERFNVNLDKLDIMKIGGVSVKYLPYDKY